LDERSGPAWRLYADSKGITLYPSIWRESGCKSHYIVWRDAIILFGQNEEDFETVALGDEMTDLAKLVLTHLPTSGLAEFVDIATEICAVPWDVLTVCRRLMREGLAREGVGRQRSAFGKV
jgi:hypothetical protein